MKHQNTSSDNVSRRAFVQTTSAIAAGTVLGRAPATADDGSAPGAPSASATTRPARVRPAATSVYPHPFLTPATEFDDVSRGNPKPFTLKGDALVAAGLTPKSWQLEVVADGSKNEVVKEAATIEKSLTIAGGTSLDLAALRELGKTHAAKFLKAMQCLNIATPLGQGLWEGVPLREVLRLCGKMSGVRRVYYWGFHNNDPKQLFQSSLSYTQAMETPPGELPAFLAYRLNGDDVPVVRGGPVRMIIPWAHGFKSIKWLQKIVLTNDYRANDTYANGNNDPESHLKSAVYLDDGPAKIAAGRPVFVSGLAISGLSGLQRVEYWIRRNDAGGILAEDDAAWRAAQWVKTQLDDPPADWSTVLPADVAPTEVLGFDRTTGKPQSWPLRYSMVSWSASIEGLERGRYEVRARAVDLNGYPQPEPRPLQKAGKNAIQMRRIEVT